MTKKRKNLILFFLFCLNCLANVFAFTPNEDQLISARSGAILNYTAPTANQPPLAKNEIVKRFCEQSLSPNVANVFSDTSDIYSAQHSLFLSLLCSHTKEIFSQPFHRSIAPSSDENYLINKISFKTLKYPRTCENTYKENCNLANITYHLITDILSDLTTLKQGNLYGVISNNFTSKKGINEAISLFAEKQLNIGKAKDDQTDFCEGKQHSYPQTCKIIAKNFKAFEKAYSKLAIIDIKKLLNDSENKVNNASLCTKNKDKPLEFDALFCNIFGSLEKGKGLLPFTNQVYNEILRYVLFSTYYRYNLETKTQPSIQDLEEIEILKNSPSTIIATTNQTLKQLNDISSSYPIHVGLLSYQEDLLWLRNNYLSKIVTPVYTLFYKLQDVQVQK